MQDTETSTVLEAFLKEISEAPASLLFLDYDGTLAPFHTDRSRAYPYPGIVSILQSIVECGKTRVIIISGRPITELRTLLTPLSDLEMWGSHGLERQSSDGSYSLISISEEDIASLAEAERRVVAAGLSSRAEIKLGGIAIHWRGMPLADATNVQALTRDSWTPLAKKSGLKLLQFEAGLELRVSHPDKGDAVRAILAELDSNMPVAYLGDDLTDEDAFKVLSGTGLAVLVRDEYRKTLASAWIRPPQQLIQFLEHWLRSISEHRHNSPALRQPSSA